MRQPELKKPSRASAKRKLNRFFFFGLLFLSCQKENLSFSLSCVLIRAPPENAALTHTDASLSTQRRCFLSGRPYANLCVRAVIAAYVSYATTEEGVTHCVRTHAASCKGDVRLLLSPQYETNFFWGGGGRQTTYP